MMMPVQKESFFHSLEVECVHGERFVSRELMRMAVFNYIDCDYHRWPCHSAGGGLSPEQLKTRTSPRAVSTLCGEDQLVDCRIEYSPSLITVTSKICAIGKTKTVNIRE